MEIYWVVQSGGEDDTLGTLLDRYDGLSDQLTVTKVDPDVSPTFVQQYVGDGTRDQQQPHCGVWGALPLMSATTTSTSMT